MVELLIVIAIIALAVALVSVALPDGDTARLEEEGARLTALLEMARAEARVSGSPVNWEPRTEADPLTDLSGAPVHFRFVGLPTALALPSRWLDALVKKPSVGAVPPNWKPYLDKLPADPWTRPYQYLNPGVRGEIDIFSFGADGQPGGEDKNADIGSWQ